MLTVIVMLFPEHEPDPLIVTLFRRLLIVVTLFCRMVILFCMDVMLLDDELDWLSTAFNRVSNWVMSKMA